MDDWQLLNNYATGNSEEAFRALVERYAGMVYHAALRQTGNAHAAEEVAQVVFITLAQKAGSVPRRPSLYGWLFRTTRFAVLNQARQNANRKRHEQEALAMQPSIESNDADSLWERITPHLNDALDKLSAADRELVMIRFFGNKSHKDVAEALGVSEETARKRISRAIERLRVIFARRGIVVSSLALAAAFAVHGAQAAPTDVASSLATVAMAKAAAGTAATSAGGISTLLASAKVPSLVAALTGLVVLAAAVFTLFKSVSHGSPLAQPLTSNLAMSFGTPDTNGSLTGPVTASKPAGDAETNAASAAALDKVKAALHDPNPTTVYPDSIMREAIAGLGDRKKAALPILEAAVNEADAEVRLRAIDGLGIIGPEAKEAAPLLLGVLRDGGFRETIPQTKYAVTELNGAVGSVPVYTDNIILYSLGQIRPSPEILPGLASLMKGNRLVCDIVYKATTQFPGGDRALQAGGWLWAIADENSKALNNAFRPLLQDPDRAVRCVAALSLVSALGDRADPGVFPVAIEMLKSDDDTFLRRHGMSVLQGAARDPSSNGPPGKPTLYAPRLGPYLNETVSALADAAYHTKREDLRLQASKMLDILSPGFRQSNPPLAAELEQQHQMDGFASKVESGEAAISEILEGLKKFPKAAPAIASYYARTGSNAVQLLPAFREALSALAPAPEASGVNRTRAVNARGRLADAMQKIAPELPKIIFTGSDAIALTRIMNENNPALQADPNRLQEVSDARQLAEWPTVKSVGGVFDVPPDEIRRLLAAVKDADAATYDALVAKVKEIDPHFFESAVGRGKEN